MRRIIPIFIILILATACPVYSYWIWTPKTGKWLDPRAQPKDTPKEQLEYAKSYYEMKKYDDAKREFNKLLKVYPKSFEASEAQYYLGRVEEDRDNLYDAFVYYQKVIDKYPFSERIQEINEREYKIGEAFMGGYKRKAMGVVLPVENPAAEIFAKVVENSIYGPLAAKAQYKLGLVLKSLLRYYEAEDAFDKVITNYPASEWVEAAKFQLAACRQALSRGPDYDQGASEDAKKQFEDFVKEHPDAVLTRDAQANIEQLKEKDAESAFRIAMFYEKQNALNAARIYYKEITENYPDSIWSAKAAERLQLLEKRK